MQTCYTYDSTTKRLTPAPKYATIDGAAVINPTREQCARMTPPAYPLADPMPPAPTPPEGKIAVPDGYELVPSEPDGYVPGIEPEDLALMEWRQKWRYEDAPPPPPRQFSKLKIVAALTAQGVWPQVKAFIEQAGLYDLYLAAQDFAEDNEYFTQGRQQLQTALAWTDEQVEAILAQAVI